jgi:hypothetical protein
MRSNYDFTVGSVSCSATRIPIGLGIGFIDMGITMYVPKGFKQGSLQCPTRVGSDLGSGRVGSKNTHRF